MDKRSDQEITMIKAIELPVVNDRVGAVSGPGEWAKDNAGTVTAVTEDRWGRFATVQMDDGRIDTCHGLTTVGIGWYKLSPVEPKADTAPIIIDGVTFTRVTCAPNSIEAKLARGDTLTADEQYVLDCIAALKARKAVSR